MKTMNRILLASLLMTMGSLLPVPVLAQVDFPDGETILRKMDENMVSDNQVVETTMIVHGRRGSRTMTAKSYIKGEEASFSEYLSPAREKGTKMLKLEDALWIYSPSTDRVIQIAGHMLRQSVMGSDLSYEDFTENQDFYSIYDATVVDEEVRYERDCWVVQMDATVEDVAYHKRKVWVDKERFIPLREERFAKSGKLLKTTDMLEVFQVDGRWYPKRMEFKDVLKQGKGTEYIIDSIQFDQDIPEMMFTKASLKK